MGLTLVTGPANSAKAQLVLERYRAALARAPILVVPRARDVEHYRRELAGRRASCSACAVEPFGGLMREIARRAGVAERPLGDAGARAAARARRRRSRRSRCWPPRRRRPASCARSRASSPSSRRAACRRRGFIAALRAWAPGADAAARYGEELAALYRGYRARARAARPARRRAARGARARRAARSSPRAGGARRCSATASTTSSRSSSTRSRRSRSASARRSRSRSRASPGGSRSPDARRRSRRCAPAPRRSSRCRRSIRYYEDPTLHHLERSLFEDAAAARPPGSAVRLLEGGDERAEAELVADRDRRARRRRLRAARHRRRHPRSAQRGRADRRGARRARRAARGGPARALRRQRARRRPARAAARRGLRGGDAADLVRWLRTPGVVAQAAFVDRFEAALLTGGIGELAPARALWEQRALAAGRARPAGGGGADGAGRRCSIAWSASSRRCSPRPWRREAALIDPWQAAALGAGRRTLRDAARAHARRSRTRARRRRPSPPRSRPSSSSCRPGPSADAVLICDALALRARRVRALFIAGRAGGSVPGAGARASRSWRRPSARSSRGPPACARRPDDALAAERYLFYALCSRPTAVAARQLA